MPKKGFLVFELSERQTTNKVTKILNVRNTKGHHLAVIAWYPGWRKYAISFGVTAIFDAECMFEIAKYLDLLMLSYKEDLAVRKANKPRPATRKQLEKMNLPPAIIDHALKMKHSIAHIKASQMY